MNKVRYLICLVFSICLACSGQPLRKNQSKYGNEIIDPVEHLPFEIGRKSNSVSLPDSLGGKKITGLSVIHLYISKATVVDSFKIVKLLTYKDGKEVINYYPGNTVNAEIERFYPFLSSYIKKDLLIKKSPGKNGQDSASLMSILVRFK